MQVLRIRPRHLARLMALRETVRESHLRSARGAIRALEGRAILLAPPETYRGDSLRAGGELLLELADGDNRCTPGSMGTHPGRYRSRKRDSHRLAELFGDRAPYSMVK